MLSCSVVKVQSRSDTLIPVRGRKLARLGQKILQKVLFRYLNPREGTETCQSFQLETWLFRSDTLIPVRGRKRNNEAVFILSIPSSDTLIPVRGRKRRLVRRLTDLIDRSDTLIPVRGRKQGCL